MLTFFLILLAVIGIAMLLNIVSAYFPQPQNPITLPSKTPLLPEKSSNEIKYQGDNEEPIEVRK